MAYSTTYTFEDTTPQDILDNSCITVTTNVVADFTVTDLNVGLMLTHTFRGDLDIEITSPAPGSITAELLTDVGGGDDDLNVLLDSSSANDIPGGDHNLGDGDYFNDSRPESAAALDVFNGVNSVGDWVIEICDDANSDEGELEQSVLIFDDSPLPISSEIATGNDDAEEQLSNGDMDTGSSDLEMIDDNGDDQIIGMRFTGINIPVDAVITSASIDFRADGDHTNAANLVFHGQAAGNASTFTSADYNISSRSRTVANVSWNVPNWDDGDDYTSPSLVTIIQEIVERADWSSNALVIMVTGDSGDRRRAESLNGDGPAPILNIEYEIPTLTSDFGDAPDADVNTGTANYRTRTLDSGPSHIVSNDLYIGTDAPDLELNGKPNTAANGDSLLNISDEDAPHFLSFSPGDTPEVRILATNNTGAQATISAWLDLDINGDFNNATERVTATVDDGSNDVEITLTFPEQVPSGLPPVTYMRIRISTDSAALNSTGEADDGEVEDHRVFINGSISDDVEKCYTVADDGNWLITVDPDTAVTDDDVTDGLGPVGFSSIEAMVWDLGDPVYVGDEILFGADTNELVRLLPEPRVSLGNFEQFDPASPGQSGNTSITDADGMAIDWQSEPPVYYASGDAGPGQFFIFDINPENGNVYNLSNQISLPITNTQIDDIAWDPINRRLLAVTNDGSDLSHLVEFDLSSYPTIPAANDCGDILYFNGTSNVILQDTEGLSFTRPGELFIVTGNGGEAATNNSLWRVPISGIVANCFDDTQDVIAERIGPANSLASAPGNGSLGDYEAVGCGNTFTTSNASIGNRVWLDEDGDGEQDGGEDGIAGVTVYLCRAGASPCDFGSAVHTEKTDANGGYLFSGVPVLDYIVAIDTDTVPTNLVNNPTYDEDGGLDHESEVSLNKIEQEYLTADFGYNWNNSPETSTPPPGTTGSIGDRVWNDANGDGIQNSNEAGLNEVIVTLYTDDDGDGTFDDAAGMTTTDGNGNYVFDGLDADAYVVQIDSNSLPVGVTWTQTGDPDEFAQAATAADNQTTSPIILAPGDVFVNADFGYQGNDANTHSIGDTIYLDSNGDGNFDGGEPGIANVTITLLDDDGNPIAQVTTDANGNYLFPGLPNGDYSVVVTDTNNILGALQQNDDPDAIFDNRSTVSLSSDDDLQDFGYIPKSHNSLLGLIGDTIYFDINDDRSQQAGEPGIEGVTVELIDEGTGFVVRSTISDENGNYYFGSLPADTYTVRVDTATLPNAGVGMVNSDDPDNGGDGDNESDVTIGGAGVDLDQDFGYNVSTPNSISGTIWNDTNADGTLDGGETNFFEGVTVNLFDGNGNIVAMTTTDVNGDYSFEGLPNGDYTVTVTDDDNVLAGNWLTDGSNDGVNNNSQIVNYEVSVTGGQNDVTSDFGYYTNLASLGNIVYRDDNNNGVRDVGDEPGIPMVPVTLEITYPNGDIITVTTLTDGAGFYSFDNLLADDSYQGGEDGDLTEPSYEITVGSVADGYFSTYDSGNADLLSIGNGTDDNSDDDTGQRAFPQKGSQDITKDFGFVPGGTIGNRVWLDLDNDGVQDANEDGIANVIVTLTPPPGGNVGAGVDVAITTVTDSEGKYIFTEIPIANGYTVSVGNIPTGLTQTYDEDDPMGPGTGAATADSTVVDISNANEEYLTADFGYNAPSGSIGDYVWSDANGDGQQDPNEIGLAGVTVYLCPTSPCTSGNATMTTITDNTGHYLFTGVSLTDTSFVRVDETDIDPSYTQTGDPDGVGSPDNQTEVPPLNTSDGINLDADFGYQPPSANHFDIGDTVYQDIDGDGFEGVGEPGVPGVTIQLIMDTTGNGIPDTPVASTITDSDGGYLFPSLPESVAYSVLVTDTNNILNGYVQTGDPDLTLDNQSTINPLNADNLSQDFGYRPLRSGNGVIGDRVFNDVDGSGTQNGGDQGLEGVTVQLFNGVNLIDSVTTDENGNYLFTGLSTDDVEYDIVVDTNTLPNGGIGWSNSVDPEMDDNSQSSVTLTQVSPISLDQDFGYEAALANTIEGTVWRDDDGNGLLTSSSPDESSNGIQNVTVVLRDTNNNIVGTTLTDANGDYTFSGLPNGSYSVSVTDDFNELANLIHTDGPNADDNLVDNNSQDDTGYLVAVTGGVTNTTADFGYKPVITTPITLASFKAVYNESTGLTKVSWSTLTETGNVGFELFTQIDGLWVQVTDKIVPSKNMYKTTLTRYEYVYEGAYVSEWAIVDIDITGKRQSHGSFKTNRSYGKDDQFIDSKTKWLDINSKHHQKLNQRNETKVKDINQYIQDQKNKQSDSQGAGS